MWSFSSRTPRLAYVAYCAISGLLSSFCFNMLKLVITRSHVTPLMVILFAFVFGALGWIASAAASRRAHDVGWSSYWLLLALIPGVGLVQGVMLAVLPGDPRANRYGAVAGRKAVPIAI